MFFGLWLAVLGVMGAASLIVARRPNAADAIAKLAPYQGWFGAISALWGVWGLISAVLGIALLTSNPIQWVLWLASAVLLVSLGLLLGVGVLKTFIKDATAQAKMDETIKKLAPYQGTLGLVSIGLGIATVVVNLIF